VETITEKNRLKILFSNSTSRMLLGLWLLVKGSRFPMKSIIELLSVTEDVLELKLQTLAGLGLVYVFTENTGNRLIEFTDVAEPEVQKIIEELFEARKSDFESEEIKSRDLIYKNLLDMTL